MPLFFFQKRRQSFGHAFRGIALLFRSETHARIHVAAAVLALAAGFIFSINTTEWLFVLGCIGAVLSLEAVNTAMEHLANKVQPEWDETIKKVKDLSAAAVLISAIIAFFIGVIIFLPKILHTTNLS